MHRTKNDLLRAKLACYAFERNELKETDLPLLMGNTEMGGLLNGDGLGFPSLWFSDLWQTQEIRMPLKGFALECADLPQNGHSQYRQQLDIATGIAETHMQGENGARYECKVFFSAAEKRLLALRLQCSKSGKGKLHIPVFERKGLPELKIFHPDPYTIYACSSENAFTRCMYIIRVNQAIEQCGEYTFNFVTDKNSPLTVLFSMHTHWCGEDFPSRCENSIAASQDFEFLSLASICARQKLWKQTAAIDIPDKELESLFYRSVYWTFCTCGADRFLPGEAQFAHDCWRMIPYTYGGAGWSVFAYAILGHDNLAHKMAREHFKSSALRHNAKTYIQAIKSGDTQAFFTPTSSGDEQQPSNPDRHFERYARGECCGGILDDSSPLSFAHQIGLHGNCRMRRAHQRGIDGFTAAMFHRLAFYYRDPVFLYQYAYPAIKGIAEFWRAIVEWDESLNAYTLPVLHSVSENLSERCILDATLSARGSLEVAARYAKQLGCDNDLAEQWHEISQELYLPHNGKFYLEYLGDKRERKGGDYFGIRGPVYLGFPWPEMIRTLNAKRALATLRDGWERNGRGAQMIGFIANWYSLSFAGLGDAAGALESLRHNLACLDQSRTTLNENPRNKKPYFSTNYTSFILALATMLVQSHDDSIKVFPALPAEWKDVVFHGIRAQKGISVSASIKGGAIEWISFSRNGIELLRAGEGTVFRILGEGDTITIKPT